MVLPTFLAIKHAPAAAKNQHIPAEAAIIPSTLIEQCALIGRVLSRGLRDVVQRSVRNIRNTRPWEAVVNSKMMLSPRQAFTLNSKHVENQDTTSETQPRHMVTKEKAREAFM